MAKPARRRDLILWLGGLAAFYAGSRWLLTRPGALNFEPVEALPGYRRLVAGPVSRGVIDPLAGIGVVPVDLPDLPGDLRPLLFPGDPAGRVPVAYFADFGCPNCAALEQSLARHVAAGEIALYRHEWPILGPGSELAARAALAAALQGAPGALDAALTSSALVVTEGYLRRIARQAGLDEGRLLRDLDAGEVNASLARTGALARRLGFYATPSMVVRRTLVIGRLPAPTLAALVEAERRGA